MLSYDADENYHYDKVVVYANSGKVVKGETTHWDSSWTWMNHSCAPTDFYERTVSIKGDGRRSVNPKPYEVTIEYSKNSHVTIASTNIPRYYWGTWGDQYMVTSETAHAERVSGQPTWMAFDALWSGFHDSAWQNAFAQACARNARKLMKRNNDTGSNFLISALESEETIKMVANAAKAVISFGLCLKSGNIRGAIRALSKMRPYEHEYIPQLKATVRRIRKLTKRQLIKSANDVFLEAKFGWDQLVQDVNAVIPQLNSAKEKMSQKRVRVKSRARVWTNNSYSRSVGYHSWDAVVTSKYALTASLEVGLSFKLTSSAVAKANSLVGLNPLALAWEVQPLSFVVDWFIGVKDFLNSFTYDLGYEFESGYETRYTEETWCKTISDGKTCSAGGKVEKGKVYVLRKPLNGPPRAYVPVLSGLRGANLATGLSLFLQRVLGRT